MKKVPTIKVVVLLIRTSPVTSITVNDICPSPVSVLASVVSISTNSHLDSNLEHEIFIETTVWFDTPY